MKVLSNFKRILILILIFSYVLFSSTFTAKTNKMVSNRRNLTKMKSLSKNKIKKLFFGDILDFFGLLPKDKPIELTSIEDPIKNNKYEPTEEPIKVVNKVPELTEKEKYISSLKANNYNPAIIEYAIKTYDENDASKDKKIKETKVDESGTTYGKKTMDSNNQKYKNTDQYKNYGVSNDNYKKTDYDQDYNQGANSGFKTQTNKYESPYNASNPSSNFNNNFINPDDPYSQYNIKPNNYPNSEKNIANNSLSYADKVFKSKIDYKKINQQNKQEQLMNDLASIKKNIKLSLDAQEKVNLVKQANDLQIKQQKELEKQLANEEQMKKEEYEKQQAIIKQQLYEEQQALEAKKKQEEEEALEKVKNEEFKKNLQKIIDAEQEIIQKHIEVEKKEKKELLEQSKKKNEKYDEENLKNGETIDANKTLDYNVDRPTLYQKIKQLRLFCINIIYCRDLATKMSVKIKKIFENVYYETFVTFRLRNDPNVTKAQIDFLKKERSDYNSSRDILLNNEDFVNSSFFSKNIKDFPDLAFFLYSGDFYNFINWNLKTKDFVEMIKVAYLDANPNGSIKEQKKILNFLEKLSIISYLIAKEISNGSNNITNDGTTLYRGFTIENSSIIGSSKSVNKYLISPNPLSFSYKLSTATDFINNNKATGRKSILFIYNNLNKSKICSGKILNQAYLAKYSGEKEYLMKPLSELQITGVSLVDGIYHVNVSCVNIKESVLINTGFELLK